MQSQSVQTEYLTCDTHEHPRFPRLRLTPHHRGHVCTDDLFLPLVIRDQHSYLQRIRHGSEYAPVRGDRHVPGTQTETGRRIHMNADQLHTWSYIVGILEQDADGIGNSLMWWLHDIGAERHG